MSNPKLYPFSLRRHDHDLFFKCNRLFNVAYDERTSPAEADRLLAERERVEAVRSKWPDASGVVWLTGAEYAIAREAVAWATVTRADADADAANRVR